ncbi:MAG: hypothetical protein COA86_15120 [Kangiella sp.]|nr:MAG: hypothetical protein COA86_15120 [Kangiella sp.]
MRHLLILFLLFSFSVSAEESQYKHAVAGFDSESELKPFYEKVRVAILSRDYETIADLLFFPAGVYVGDKPTEVRSKKEFIALGDDIINERLLRAVYCSSYVALWSNYRGVALGQGEVWINMIKENDDDPWETVIWRINNKPYIGTNSRKDGACFYSEEVNKKFQNIQAKKTPEIMN